MAGFSNAEEAAVGKDQAVPYLLESRLKELGGLYTAGPDWLPHAGAGPAPACREGAARGARCALSPRWCSASDVALRCPSVPRVVWLQWRQAS